MLILACPMSQTRRDAKRKMTTAALPPRFPSRIYCRTVFSRTLVLAAVVTFLMLTGAFAAGPTAVPDSPPDLPKGPPPPPVPFLSADEAIKTIKLPAGFRIEAVAAEPLIEHPVAMTFDADGRMWVVEMRSYMPDVEGSGESAPTGRITMLQDDDGDGRMDRTTVFLDHLVLPRAIAAVRDGLLVAVPPKLVFCRDTNGDGKCDQQTVVASDYGVRGNPEHMPNGLLLDIDNWIYSANYDKRLRWNPGGGGAWIAEFVPELGQWGISQDNFGRLFHNTNTDQLRASLIPPHYADRNSHYRTAAAVNEQIAKDQSVYPAHATAVDRGYLDNIMRPDGTLRAFTAACAPLIYRGGLFPADFDGNAFVCEPAANLVKRNIVRESDDGSLVASNAYEKTEFVTSTYERFRPVNLTLGPDGGIYVVDMHHGLLQHKTYLTTYCRELYEAKQLDKHLGTGRIYRIVPVNADVKRAARPQLSKATTAQLAEHLADKNGWWRDTAQRLLVERGDVKSIAMLSGVARKHNDPLARLHALWTLEGMRIRDPNVILPALADADPKIRAAAIRLAEPLFTTPAKAKASAAVLKLVNDKQPDVRLQFALTVSAMTTPESDSAIASMLTDDSGSLRICEAIVTGVRGREMDVLERLLGQPQWSKSQRGRDDMLTALARCITTEASPRRVARLLEIVSEQGTDRAWRQVALLNAFGPLTGVKRPRPLKPIMLDAEPAKFLALMSSSDATADLQSKLKQARDRIHWPGEPGYTPPPPPPPLTEKQQAQFERGRLVYAATCAACHKPNGLGQIGLAPPLADSEWVLESPRRLARIILHGVQGPITVDGESFNLDMPGLGKLRDDEIADVMTYVRRSWDNGASPVEARDVTKIRATTRPVPWTERELLRIR